MKSVRPFYLFKNLSVKTNKGEYFIDKLIDIKGANLTFKHRKLTCGEIKSLEIARLPEYEWNIPRILFYSSHYIYIDEKSVHKYPDKCPIYHENPPPQLDEFRALVEEARIKDLKRRGKWREPKRNICGRDLSWDGECPEHGRVRTTQEQRLEQEIERKKEKLEELEERKKRPYRKSFVKKRFPKGFDKVRSEKNKK